jgi:hypothetical protein
MIISKVLELHVAIPLDPLASGIFAMPGSVTVKLVEPGGGVSCDVVVAAVVRLDAETLVGQAVAVVALLMHVAAFVGVVTLPLHGNEQLL